MKIDLLKIYEENKKEKENFEEVKKEYKEKEELNEIMATIIKGQDKCVIKDKQIIDKLGIKSKKKQRQNMWMTEEVYEFNLNKTNIERIQKYLDEENKC